MEEKTVIETMAEDLVRIREALEKLESLGINQELMILYIQNKSHVGKNVIKSVLEGQREFLREAFAKKKNV